MTKKITRTYEIRPGADLRRADLREANLRGAYLLGMKIDDGQGNVYECQKDGWSIIGIK